MAYRGPVWVPVNETTLSAYPADYSTFFSAVCFWTGSAVYDSLQGKVPIGLVAAAYGGTSAEAWTSADAVGACGPYNLPPNPPTYMLASVAYNAMIHPILRMTMTAVVWYQVSDFTHHPAQLSHTATRSSTHSFHSLSLSLYCVRSGRE